jgi:hypothetical protein
VNEKWDRDYTFIVLNQLVISAIVITLVDEVFPAAISLMANNKGKFMKGLLSSFWV